jgi:hypothetical protein
MGRVFTGMICVTNERADGSISREYVMPIQGVLNDDLTSGPVSIPWQASFYPYPGIRNTTVFDGWWENLGGGKARLAKWVQTHGEPAFEFESEWYHYTYRASATLYKDSNSISSCAGPLQPSPYNYCIPKDSAANGNLTKNLPDVLCSKSLDEILQEAGL